MERTFRIGDIVIFHAYQKQHDTTVSPLHKEAITFLCKGVIIRQSRNNKPYKVVITEVNTTTLFDGKQESLAQGLLNKKIVKSGTDLSLVKEVSLNLYKNQTWIKIDISDWGKILKRINQE